MIPKLDTIGRMRIKLGITQKKLASMAGVSTSMINQIESNSCKPSYETARRIFDSLVTLEGSASKKKAGDVCSGDIIKIDINDKLDAAVSKMRKFSISQIPVFDKNALVGLVTEDGIMRHLDSDGADIKNTVVSSIIEPAPAVVDYNTPTNALVALIRITKCILVSKNSNIIGIITASDTLQISRIKYFDYFECSQSSASTPESDFGCTIIIAYRRSWLDARYNCIFYIRTIAVKMSHDSILCY